MAAAAQPRTRPAWAMSGQKQEEILQPVIVLTDCASPFRIIGVSANWGHTFGTSASKVVGRSINLLFGPMTDVKAFYNVLKQASNSISTATSTVMYEKSGLEKRFAVFGRGSDVISPPACELYFYPIDAVKSALTSNTMLVVQSEAPHRITCETGDHMETSCLDVVGRPLLEVYSACGLDVTRLSGLLQQASTEGDKTFRELMWGDVDVRVTAEGSAGVILVAFETSLEFQESSSVCKMVEACTLHGSCSLPESPALRKPTPDQVHLLIQEGGGFAQRFDDSLLFVRVSINGKVIESKAKDDASPLWNEEHQLALQELPAVVCVEAVARTGSGIEHLVGSAELELGNQTLAGYCDDWIQLQSAKGGAPRVRVAISCEKDHMEKIKNGLYPSGAHKFSVNELSEQ